MATNKKIATKKVVKKTTRYNPTLHKLLVARTLSGTVVRTLLFIILSAALVVVATTNVDEGRLGAVAVLGLMTAVYFLFDVLYVLMANIRPLHPRFDRIVLPAGLVFSLVGLYAPLFVVTDATINVINMWLAAGVGLVLVLILRLALLAVSLHE